MRQNLGAKRVPVPVPSSLNDGINTLSVDFVFGLTTALAGCVIIPVQSSTAAAPKGIPSAQTSGSQSGKDGGPFASLLSSSDLLNTDSQKASPASPCNAKWAVLNTLTTPMVTSTLAQSATVGETLPLGDGMAKGNGKTTLAGGQMLGAKRQKRSDDEEPGSVPVALPLATPAKFLSLNVAPDSLAGILAWGEPIPQRLQNATVQTTGKAVPGQKNTSPMASQSVEAAIETTGPTMPTKAANAATTDPGYLSFLVKMVDPSRAATSATVKVSIAPLDAQATTFAHDRVFVSMPSEGPTRLPNFLIPTLHPTPATAPTNIADLPLISTTKFAASAILDSQDQPLPALLQPPPSTQRSTASTFDPTAMVLLTTPGQDGRNQSFNGQGPQSSHSRPIPRDLLQTGPESQQTSFDAAVNTESIKAETTKIDGAKTGVTKAGEFKINGARPNDLLTNPALPTLPNSALATSVNFDASQSQPRDPGSAQSERPPAPPPPRPPTLPAQLPQATAASQIAIRLDSGNDSGQVELRIRERAGEVQIAVRSTDQGVATTLREDLGDLVKRLEPHAAAMDLLRQEANPAESSSQHAASHIPGSDSSRGYFYFSDAAQQQPRQRQQQQQQNRPSAPQPDAAPDALEELRSAFNDLTTGAFLS